MSNERHTYPVPEEAAEACCRRILTALEKTLADAPRATFAMSGGTAVKLLFPRLAAASVPWERVHLFWVDERAVPPSHEHSNYRLANELLIRPAQIPRRNVHRIHGELPPHAAADRYNADIRAFFGLEAGELPQFDLLHLGMGPDAHTASLFPRDPLISDYQNIAAATYVEKLEQWRITLLPGVLLNARETVVFVTGGEKAHAVRAVFEEPCDPKRYPAQLVVHRGQAVSWFVDEAAERLLDRTKT